MTSRVLRCQGTFEGVTRRSWLAGALSLAGSGALLSPADALLSPADALPSPADADGAAGGSAANAPSAHGLAMHGVPLLPPGFDHFASVNPQAPRGGELAQAVVGSFDSMNPFIVRGTPPPIVRWNIIESLMVRGPDEAFTLYGLLARSVETDAARSYVAFTMDPAARFADGAAVTADDVLFSFELLRAKGRPNLRSYYGKVARATVDRGTIRFDFAVEDRELPLILGLMPVLARHATDPLRFEETSFQPPLGSGPYIAAEVRPGERVILARAPDYWARDLPVTRGLYNFDRLRYDFYRDVTGAFEAFKRGLADVRFETDPGRWKTGYDVPAVRTGRVVLEEIVAGTPRPYAALIFNMRRAPLDDARVRAALVELFDFEWINANLYFGVYRRTASFYEGSDLSARGRPAEAVERALLAPFPDAVLPAVMDGTWQPPASDGSGRDRARLRRALDLLGEAGFVLERRVMTAQATGRPLSFELMVATRDQERLALAYQSMLRRAGIRLTVRLVDAVQFEARKRSYDYDMVPYIWDQSLSPGNEQAFYFGSTAAEEPGSRNFMGLRSPAADAMIAALLAARERPQFVAAVRALDRVLMSAQFGVPLFHTGGQWLARWTSIERPPTTALAGTLAESWWRAQ